MSPNTVFDITALHAASSKWWNEIKAAVSDTDNVLLAHRVALQTAIAMLFGILTLSVCLMCCICSWCHQRESSSSPNYKSTTKEVAHEGDEEEGLLEGERWERQRRSVRKPKHKSKSKNNQYTKRKEENSATDQW